MRWMIWCIQSGPMCIIFLEMARGPVPPGTLHVCCFVFCQIVAIILAGQPFLKKPIRFSWRRQLNVLWRNLFLNIRCKTLMWVIKGYYLHVCWNYCIFDICMIKTIAHDVIYVIIFPGNIARLFCKKWVNFIRFILLLVEKQDNMGSFHF